MYKTIDLFVNVGAKTDDFDSGIMVSSRLDKA